MHWWGYEGEIIIIDQEGLLIQNTSGYWALTSKVVTSSSEVWDPRNITKLTFNFMLDF
jgi:hypothetical protein